MNLKAFSLKLEKANIGVAIISLSSVLIFPVLFLFIDPTRHNQLIVLTTLGFVFSYSLILATCLRIANYSGNRLLAIFIKWRWVPILVGTSGLFAFIGKLAQENLPSTLPYVALFVFVVMLHALYPVIIALENLNKRAKQPADSAAEINDFLSDLDRLFNPETSNATTLFHISKLEDNRELSSHLLEEYLINQGCTLDIISQQITGDSVIKISAGEQIAYTKSINLSIRQYQQYAKTKNVEDLPSDAMQWDILIAVIDSPALQTKIELAIKALTQHHETKFARKFDVSEYQTLGELCDYGHEIATTANQVVSIGHHRGTIEITTKHPWSDDSGIMMERSESICRYNDGLFACKSEAINEDLTVATPDVEVNYFTLPYPQCRLTTLNVLDEGRASNTLYLTFVRIEDGGLTSDETTLTAEFCNSTVVFGDNVERPGQVIGVEQYLAKYCIKYLT